MTVVFESNLCVEEVTGNQSVTEKLDQDWAESQIIETVTSFGVAHQHLLFRMLMHVWFIPFQPHVIFFRISLWQNYSATMTRIDAESTNSPKCDLSLSANRKIYHIGMCERVRNIPGLSH